MERVTSKRDRLGLCTHSRLGFNRLYRQRSPATGCRNAETRPVGRRARGRAGLRGSAGAPGRAQPRALTAGCSGPPWRSPFSCGPPAVGHTQSGRCKRLLPLGATDRASLLADLHATL